MCGIVGIIGNQEVASRLTEGLTRLEYRGYDSAGIAVLSNGTVSRRRAVGKLEALRAVLADSPISGQVGIGHTRWATHGAPTVSNAHPHAGSSVAIVHNGIIENYAEIRERLISQGVNFESETDTEVVAKAIGQRLTEGLAMRDAFAETLGELQGAFGLAALCEAEPETLFCARRGSPLAIGRGDGEMFIGSDAYALAPFTNRVTYLADGDWAVVGRDQFELFGEDNKPVERPQEISDASATMVDKGEHRHFMAKEIYEQPEVIGHTLSTYIDPVRMQITLPSDSIDFSAIRTLTMSACGTAYYAVQAAKYWFETFAKMPVDHDIASELRYRDVPYQPDGAAIFVSQSGETADTLAALRDARAAGQKIASVVNVPESTIARESDVLYPTYAGPEIGVASTKAFTCQLATLACLSVAAGVSRGVLSHEQERTLIEALLEVPRLVAAAISTGTDIEKIAAGIAEARDVLFLGRGVSYPLAMEGALKLKEISYIHAEGYAAGELKHGPIALIDRDVPVIVLAPRDQWFEKSISNMQEVMARGGKCILISDAEGIAEARRGGEPWATLQVPTITNLFAPLVYAVPIQLLAYYGAIAKGTDVDQPRNLAKSVTVE
ncbi:MAG: glutamine--fructose-6-phosphate transaminase (isomerizing) [Parvularcula sp.]